MTTDTLHEQKILILDFGSQYTQNIARKIRESQVYCEIYPCTLAFDEIKAFKAKGIILSGGPSSVLKEDSPLCDRRLFEMEIPILGICYGMQLLTHILGGKVDPSRHREFGRAELMLKEFSHLFEGVKNNSTVWMSHGDRISKVPNGFNAIAFTGNSPLAAIENPVARIYGLQFHPEVVHTVEGTNILNNFLFKICECARNWKVESLVTYMIENIRSQVGNDRVICGLSGGVDSSVAAVLIHKAIGDNLSCMFIDNGLLRSGEREKVENTFLTHLKYKEMVYLFYAYIQGFDFSLI